MHNILIATSFFWRNSPQCAMASSFTRFLYVDHTRRRITVGRTPPDEWSARRREFYLTTHNTHNRQTSMWDVGFEPTIPASDHWDRQLSLLFTLNLYVYTRMTRKSLHLPATGWCTRYQDTTAYSKSTCSFTHNYFMYISLMMIPYKSKHFGMYYFNTNNTDR